MPGRHVKNSKHFTTLTDNLQNLRNHESVQKLKDHQGFKSLRSLKDGRNRAPVAGVVLAGALAGTLALAPMDGGSAESSSDPVTTLTADRQQEPPAPKAPPSAPPEDCKPGEDTSGGYPNGRIPLDELCELPQGDEHLRADAAVAFYKLNVAYHERFGKEMCVRSSYRSYDKQRELYRRMPSGMAARPGNSKHGIGIAVDLCDGVQNADSPQFKWLEDNAEKYGWKHPAWAYSNPYEPWHWELDVGQA